MASGKGIPNVYLWCSKIEKPGKTFGMRKVAMLNCVVKVEGHKKCTFHGKPAKCVETAFAYEIPSKDYPKYRGRRKRR